jgi:hypothetical protein
MGLQHQELCSKETEKDEMERARKFISFCTVGSGEKLIEEEAEKVCARPHSGIRLSLSSTKLTMTA